MEVEVNYLGLIATALALIVPTAFLLVLYLQTASREAAKK
jgi:photosystem II PsbM protein